MTQLDPEVLKMFDTPWLKDHVNNHLIFGPLSWLFGYEDVALLWCATKFTLGIVCFSLIIMGGLVGFFAKKPDWIHAIIFTTLWFPGPEFIPSLQRKQKIITIIRILLSPIILYLWHQTGSWTSTSSASYY